MATSLRNPFADARGEHREDVQFRTRSAGTGGGRNALLIVNVSPGGMMIRTDAIYAEGDALRVQLPVLGDVEAKVVWALGGRIGCQLAERIPAHLYHAVLAGMR